MRTYRYFTIISFLFGLLISNGQEQKLDTTFNAQSKTLLVVPLIENNPTIETGFGGLGMFFFTLDEDDEISPPSLISVYGIYSTNKSHIFTPMGRFFGGG